MYISVISTFAGCDFPECSLYEFINVKGTESINTSAEHVIIDLKGLSF